MAPPPTISLNFIPEWQLMFKDCVFSLLVVVTFLVFGWFCVVILSTKLGWLALWSISYTVCWEIIASNMKLLRITVFKWLVELSNSMCHVCVGPRKTFYTTGKLLADDRIGRFAIELDNSFQNDTSLVGAVSGGREQNPVLYFCFNNINGYTHGM